MVPASRAQRWHRAGTIGLPVSCPERACLDSAGDIGEIWIVGPPLGMGVLLLAVAPVLWGLAVAQVRELRRGTLLHATVTGHSTYMRRGQAMDSARFAVTIDGQTIEGTSQMATSWSAPPIGALVPVRHRPGDELPLRDVSLAQYLAAATYAVLGTALGGVGVGVLMGGNPAWW